MTKTTGAVCPKHPELEGLRYTRSRNCVGCRSDEATQRYAASKRLPLLEAELQQLRDGQAGARLLIEEAWRLLDGQDPKTAEWHLAASAYLNEVRA